jgi:hypothetical protein
VGSGFARGGQSRCWQSAVPGATKGTSCSDDRDPRPAARSWPRSILPRRLAVATRMGSNCG